MTDKHYVDADKLLDWAKVGLGSAKLYTKLECEIESGRIDPDPPQQEPYIGYRKGEPVRHKTRKLHEATFEKWSKSGKRIGVKHNYGYPFGVSIAVDYFDPRNIEKAEGEES
jgi:hypothetical protein